MKIRIIGLENEIDLNSDDVVNVIIIKDVNYFSNIIKIINDSMNGIETNEVFLLGDEEEELKINKECYLLLDLFNIDYNSKKVLTKIYDYIEDNVKNNQDYEVERLVLKIRNYLIQEINELPFEFTMKSELEIAEILKLFSLKIDDENYQTILEKVEILIDILSTLEISKILIIPNLKLYLNNNELVELYKYSLYNNIKLILIEREDYCKLKYEKVITIDENFYDYIQ